MSSGLYSGVSGLAIGTGLYRSVSGLWSGASGLVAGWGGAGAPTLNLNLLSGPLDSRITFTRPSAATYFNSSGVITLAAVDEARFDYYPLAYGPRGLLLEGARTNVLTSSLIDGTSLSTQTVTVAATAYTLSFYGTGTVTLSGTASAVVVGTGAFPRRVTYTFTPTAGSLTVTVSGTVQYAQLEAGTFASSFIPTDATVGGITREADSAVMLGANFSSWYNPSVGSIVYSAEPEFSSLSATPSAIMISGYAEFQALYVNATTRAIGYDVGVLGLSLNFVSQVYSYTPTGTLQASLTSGTAPLGYVYGQAVAYGTDDFANSGNGAPASVDTSGTVPTGVSSLTLGPSTSALGYTGWFGWIRNVTAYGVRLSNSQLVASSAVPIIPNAALVMDFTNNVYYTSP